MSNDGRDCPIGKIQVEFVGVDPELRMNDYGYLPSGDAFIDVWVDGKRFNIQIGTYESSEGPRRGLHIVTDSMLDIDKHSINAIDLWIKK